MGDAIATNMFMLGYAVQRGLVPVSLEALLKAIELNGTAIDSNIRSLNWGRLYAQDPKAVEDIARTAMPRSEETTYELQSLMRISYAVFCLKKTHMNTTNTKSPIN